MIEEKWEGLKSISDECRRSILQMTREICHLLNGANHSIYLFGSAVLDDFRFGWSDMDILVLTESKLTEEQAHELVALRQTMLPREPGNPYYRSFEGGMLSLEAFLHGKEDRVVYWGTSGERITNSYHLDCFSRAQLLEQGLLLFGDDIRSEIKAPTPDELYSAVKSHYQAVRRYAQKTERSLYSFGWMLDIARCIYTLRTGQIIPKTEAGAWALEHNLCPEPDVMAYVLKVRKAPMKYKSDEKALDYAEALTGPIQRFADALENELKIWSHYPEREAV